jgi:non-canonical purine NTP pyrophosphatase (RdgB/HAM1 family)
VSTEVVLASSNPGKAREAANILGPLGFEIVTLPMWLGDVETGATYLENARLKAAAAVRMLQRPVLAEDSGLEVDALGGLPGLHSARFAGPDASDADNNAKLLALLSNADGAARSARYRAVAVLLFPDGREVVGEGTFEGTIAAVPRGDGGFGYDPLFVPEGEERTAAELTPQQKDAISHRGAALRALASKL